VCHGCYDAPCQLKLDSFEGLLRGANSEKVYDGTRILGAPLTRLFEDAKSNREWRTKGFHPVLNERNHSVDANINGGVLAQSLLLKKLNPLPTEAILPESFDFTLDKKQYCPTIETFESFAQERPMWGMPYALPALAEDEHTLIMRWLSDGAPSGLPPKLPAAALGRITKWEAFFNGDSLKQQLVNRYIYEHLFLASIYFDEAPSTYFKLVRSSTPPGKPIERIVTNRPFDNPKVNRVYYRLWADPSSVVAKNHMPYALNSKRMQKWQQLFYGEDYSVTQLPSYAPEFASNPFLTFVELPISARYRFMLDEAQFTIMNFIKGPVCRGQVALNVIQNHFWVFFFDPKTQDNKNLAAFLKENSQYLQLPAEVGNTLLPINNWLKYADYQKEYLVAKGKFVDDIITQEKALGLDAIWDGDKGQNKGAALTIFRHKDSASVHQGLIGQSPKTAWIIGYPLLERIHYLLVAGFDVYGNVSHQFLSRVYMDFLRMESEMDFVEFLPETTQEKELAYWYRDADTDLKNYINRYQKQLGNHNRITYLTSNPKEELFQKLRTRIGNASYSPHHIEKNESTNIHERKLADLENLRGSLLQFLPQNTIIRIPTLGVYTLIHNNAYSNLSSLFNEEKRHIKDEDNLTLARGIIGAYPNAFMLVEKNDIDDFVNRIQTIKSETDYQALRDLYGIRRSSPHFWAFSDELHQYYLSSEPKEAGLLDYNRLENR